MVGFTIALLIIAAALFWQRDKHLRDAQIQRAADGEWTNSYDGFTILFRPDGSYLDWKRSAVTGRSNSWAGTWGVGHGCIIRVMTNIDVGLPARLYTLPHFGIIHIDGQKMVYQLQGGARVPTDVFRKMVYLLQRHPRDPHTLTNVFTLLKQ